MRDAMKRTATTTLAVAVVIALAGCGNSAATESKDAEATNCAQPGTTGITDTTIKVGQTLPQSGAVAQFGGIGYGVKAYFDKINAEGGVKMGDGKTRKLELVTADDAYEPSKTTAKTKELLENDEVFAFVGSFGSATQLAVKPLLEEDCAPSLWIGSASPKLQTPENPLQLGSSVPAQVETKIWVEYVRKNFPNATVAVLAQNGELSKPYLETLTKGLEGSNVKIVATETYEPTDTDVRQQMTTLAATKADLLFLPATATPAKQAINHAHALGWAPTILGAYSTTLDQKNIAQIDKGATDKLVVLQQYRDTDGPAAKDDKVVQDYVKWFTEAGGLKQYTLLDGKPGWHSAQLFVASLKNMKNANRAELIKASHNLELTEESLVVPGVKLKTSEPDDFMIQQGMGLQRWNSATNQLDTIDVIDVG